MENDGKTVEWLSVSDGTWGRVEKVGVEVMERRLESDGKVVEE